MGDFQLGIVYIEWELRVEFVSTDTRSWTLSFAGADVETAQLKPQHSSDMCFYGPEAILGTVSV